MNEETPAPPPGILLADHFVRLAGYHSYRSAGTRDWLMTYTIGGEGRYRIGSLVQRVGAGEIALLAPAAPLSRQFKAAYGMSPTTYRAQSQKHFS